MCDSVESKHVSPLSHYMFNITSVVFDRPSPPFHFTDTSGWNTSSSNTLEMISKMDERRKWKNVNTEEGTKNYRKLRHELKGATDNAKKEYI